MLTQHSPYNDYRGIEYLETFSGYVLVPAYQA
jgi:hypothetical protein